jgi:hypothetical protein
VESEVGGRRSEVGRVRAKHAEDAKDFNQNGLQGMVTQDQGIVLCAGLREIHSD